jgi:hypothetical protein
MTRRLLRYPHAGLRPHCSPHFGGYDDACDPYSFGDVDFVCGLGAATNFHYREQLTPGRYPRWTLEAGQSWERPGSYSGIWTGTSCL